MQLNVYSIMEKHRIPTEMKLKVNEKTAPGYPVYICMD
jgi:hypothetical protein